MADWIPYETSDTPSLEVSVDVDFADDDTFRKAHPNLLTITASSFATDSDGQPTDASAQALFSLEQQLEAVCDEHDAAAVCTVSGAASYKIYVYAAGAEAAAALRDRVTGLQIPIDIQSQRDDAWATYERYVLRGEELEEARDNDQIAQMDEAGEDLTQEFDVVFDCEIPEGKEDAAQRALRNAGFDTEEESYDGMIEASRSMRVTPENLKAARRQIASAITPLGGSYEGWGIDPDADEAQYEDDED
ncbi:MAG TPA: DUF695 domain-containing protein [Candidatus Acidoferrum sp.]|nr:DUF695 domain-containing protein [Candidatus Acidoferrum sp.]